MNDIRIYHSPEWMKKKVILKDKSTTIRYLSTRATLGYIILDNTAYIAAARCSESDRFSKKIGVSYVTQRLENSKYTIVLRLNGVAFKNKSVPRSILNGVAEAVMLKQIKIAS